MSIQIKHKGVKTMAKQEKEKGVITSIIKDLLEKSNDEATKQNIKEIIEKYNIDYNVEPIELKDLECGKTFTYKGYEFTKLANEEESCYCLLNDSAFESEFGKTNDWAKSPIRKKLNDFDKQGNSKVLPNINENDLVNVSLNYYAYKIPNGRTEDKITILSWEEAYAYDFKNIEETAWLRSGYRYSASHAYVLDSSGSYNNYVTTSSYAVRPALHLKSDIKIN